MSLTPCESLSDVRTAEPFDVEQQLLIENLTQHGVHLPKDVVGKYTVQEDGKGSSDIHFTPTIECVSAMTTEGILHAKHLAGEKPSFYHMPGMNSGPVFSGNRLAPAPSQYHMESLCEEYCIDAARSRMPETPLNRNPPIALTPSMSAHSPSVCMSASSVIPPNVCHPALSQEKNTPGVQSTAFSQYVSEMLY